MFCSEVLRVFHVLRGLILCRAQGGGECAAWYNVERKDNEADTVSSEPNGTLPQVGDVLVPKPKIVAYLLNPLYPKSASKAKFLRAECFHVSIGKSWRALSANTLEIVPLFTWKGRNTAHCTSLKACYIPRMASALLCAVYG